jgi:hypothetical protein
LKWYTATHHLPYFHISRAQLGWSPWHDRDEFLAEIKERLMQSKQLMKRAHDKQHRDIEFAVGDWVWLRLSHWPAASVRPAGAGKLSAKYFGPYQIMDKVGSMSYRLQLPAHAKIHNVFHVVFLKKFEGMLSTVTPPLPPIVHGARCQFRNAWYALGQLRRLGSCWHSGKVERQQKLLGRRWHSSRRPI